MEKEERNIADRGLTSQGPLSHIGKCLKLSAVLKNLKCVWRKPMGSER